MTPHLLAFSSMALHQHNLRTLPLRPANARRYRHRTGGALWHHDTESKAGDRVASARTAARGRKPRKR